MRLQKDQQLVLIENANPIMARKMRWYDDPVLSPKGVNLHQLRANHERDAIRTAEALDALPEPIGEAQTDEEAATTA